MQNLALTAEVFGLLSGLFFIGYFLFEVPSNLMLKKFGAKLWISRIMFTWGIIVVLTGFAQSATHLYILRFLLGVAEAGFTPGIILYLTYWFRARERGKATAVFLLHLPLECIDRCAAVNLDHRYDFMEWFSRLEMDVHFRRHTSCPIRNCRFVLHDK